MRWNGRHLIKKRLSRFGPGIPFLHVDPAKLAATKESSFVDAFAKNSPFC
jgi:hypothetical protein